MSLEKRMESVGFDVSLACTTPEETSDTDESADFSNSEADESCFGSEPQSPAATNEDLARPLYHVALFIRSQITAMNNTMPWPPSTDDLRQTQQLPSALFNLLAWIINGDEDDGAVVSTERQTTVSSPQTLRHVMSVAEDILHCASRGRLKTPKHIYLPMAVRNMTDSSQVVALLNRFGHGLSSSQMQELDTALAKRQLQRNVDEVFLPSNIDSNGHSISFCWDNNDIMEETLSDVATTHCTNELFYREDSLLYIHKQKFLHLCMCTVTADRLLHCLALSQWST